MNWLYYLAEANIYLGVFYLAYCLFLNRDTHYQLNRAYLVFSCIIAFILPVLQMGALRPVKHAEPVITNNHYIQPAVEHIAAPQNFVINAVPKTPVMATYITAATIKPTVFVVEHHFTVQDGLWYLYLIGAAVVLVTLFIKLYQLFRLMRNTERIKQGNHQTIHLPGTDIAFSFFNYMFIGANVSGADIIIRHEMVHMRQKHSADIMFLELLKIVNWFNPVIYLLQNSLKTVHEYIADEQTAAHETDALTYSSFLVKNAYGAAGLSITHSFFNYNLLKRRIIMLNRKRSGNLARLKYLVVIPICAALLCTSTLAFSKTYGWFDLVPAHFKLTDGYAMAPSHLMSKKHLKITQNGLTTITDQFAVEQKNQQVVYTAGNITKTDQALLLKNHHIKAEVVVDSTQFTNTDGQLILPGVNVDGYYLMDHFLHKNISYTPAKGEKGGLVEIGFTLDNDRHIVNAKVVKSGGDKLDALALNGFNAYKGVVTDGPGKHLKIGVYFFTDDYSIFKTDSLGNDPEFGGELIITNYKYPVARTNKGYEYDESGTSFPGDNTNTSYAKVVIYDKNGEANWFYKSKCTAADLQLLKDKYGYSFPSSSSFIVQFMNYKNSQNKRLAYVFDVTSYLDEPYAKQFYNDMLNTIAYPSQAKKALEGGVVVLNFNLDKDGLIGNIKVVQSAGHGFDEAVLTAFQSYKTAIKDREGKHSIAVSFCVAEKKYRPLVSENIKRNGYVGELAICDVKSPIVNGSARYIPAPAVQKTDAH